MKIPASVASIYAKYFEQATDAKSKLDNLMRTACEDRWHYESRIKNIEGFALKFETGRSNFAEDILAATVVVENRDKIPAAEALVKKLFKLTARRPPKDGDTHKRPDAFPFDDLRLYVALKPEVRGPVAGKEFVFEIQIKTYLQHAWAIATHELVYKAGQPDWALERIAFQVKAMLEHSEAAIAGAKDMSKVQMLTTSDSVTRRKISTIRFLKKHWSDDRLPSHLARLAESVETLLAAMKVSMEGLDAALAEETAAGRGTQTLALSPYGVIVETLLRRFEANVQEFCTRDQEKFVLRVYPEIDFGSKLADEYPNRCKGLPDGG